MRSVKCNMYILFFHCYCFNKIKKKTDPSFGLGKKLKSYATIAPLSIFSLGKGRETLIPQTLLKTFNILQSALSDQKPLQCTSLDLQCVCDTLQNCPFLEDYMYIFHEFCTSLVTEGNKILHLHFSSQLQAENSSKNHKKYKFLAFPHPKSHEFLRPLNYSQLETKES